MPNRILKESINESEGLSETSIFAEDLYKRLIVYADDYGRFNADCQIMRARLYPREMEIVRISDIEDALIELSGAGKIAFYTSSVGHKTYGCFPRWKEHQRIRDSKPKCPDPEDTTINDSYLQRFVPMALKRAVIERDGFKCQICGKYVTAIENSYALTKMGAGLFHIDHIVPVSQGGRATMENLRLTCPKCNLERKKKFKAEELISDGRTFPGFAASCGELRQVAASCGKLRPESESNPESKSNKESESFCSEQPAAAEPPVITLQLNTGEEYPITQEDVDEWAKLYPAVDVMQALRSMKGWCLNNPRKRKTKSGIRRFVNSWLAREQDEGGTPGYVRRNSRSSQNSSVEQFAQMAREWADE